MSTLNVIEHSPNLVHLAFTRDKNVLRYEIRSARTLDGAYVGSAGSPRNGVASTAPSDPIFEVLEGADFRSTGLRRRRLGVMEESNRGLTIVKYDPDEFLGASFPAAAPDRDFAYVTFREFRRATGAYAPEGGIHIIPPPGFYGMRQPILNIAGTAPLIAGTTAGLPPLPESMVIVLPKYMGSFTFDNTGSNPIFAAYESRMPMREIPAGETFNLTNSEQNLLILAATTAATTFSLSGAIQNTAF